MKPTNLVVLVGVVVAFVLSGSTASAGPGTSDTVVFAVVSPVPSGGFNTGVGSAAVMGKAEAIRGAYIQNDKGDWIEDLAHGSVSRSSVTFTIKPSASWYWGGRKLPLTYRDFVYTWQNDGGLDYAHIARFSHTGERQVTFYWRTSGCSTDSPCGPVANWQNLFSLVYPAAALAGLDFKTIWTDCICGNDGKPVANGPFYVDDPAKTGTTLLRNPYWSGTRPRIARIVFRVISDPNLQVEAMRRGTVDAILPAFDPALLKGAPGVSFDVADTNGLEHLEFREGSAKGGPTVHKGSSNELLRAPWMRQATSLAIDRQAIIRALYPGLGVERADSLLFYPSQSGYRPTFARWNYDAAKALALLKAHCTGGPSKPSPDNKKVWECAGLPATIRWTWPAEQAPRTQLEALAKANLEAVGIEVTDWPLPAKAIFSPDTGIPSGDFDVADFAWSGSGDPGDFEHNLRCLGDGNWSGYCSKAVDDLLTKANRELDPARRTALFQQADRILAAAVPWVPLFARPALLIHKSGLLGLHAGAPFWNVEDWHWKQ